MTYIPNFVPPNGGDKKAKKNPVNVLRGARNHALGEAFEEIIDNACEYYFQTKKAVIEKTPEPMKVIRNLGNGLFEACFKKRAQPDYKGSIANGRTIVFEAKFTSTDRMNASVVTSEQWKRLEAYYNIGAICFVVAGFGTGNSYRVPWRIWRSMADYYGHKYITESDVICYRLSYANGILDFLGKTPKYEVSMVEP